MRKFMKNLLRVALGLALLVPVSAPRAEEANQAPKDGVRGGLHENLTFQGRKVKRIIASATPALLVDGPGFLDAICPFQGTLGKYSQAFDTNAIAGLQAGGAGSQNYAISPPVYTRVASSQWGPSGNPYAARECWEPSGGPQKFVYALYGAQDDAGHNTLYLVHCSDGSNPCEP